MATETITSIEAVRICAGPGCKNQLEKRQKRFCCKECLNKDIATGEGAHAPTKYKTEYANKRLYEYFEHCTKEFKRYLRAEKMPIVLETKTARNKKSWAKIDAENERRVDEMLDRPPLPSVISYCEYIKVPTSTIYYWAEVHAEMQSALDIIKEKQQLWLIENGLVGRYTPVYGKLALVNWHNMTDKSQETIIDPAKIVRELYNAADRDLIKYRNGKRA
jgi:hypothetical protein